jgi:hypothetical protein
VRALAPTMSNAKTVRFALAIGLKELLNLDPWPARERLKIVRRKCQGLPCDWSAKLPLDGLEMFLVRLREHIQLGPNDCGDSELIRVALCVCIQKRL